MRSSGTAPTKRGQDGEREKNEETVESVCLRLLDEAEKGKVGEIKRLLQHPLVDPSFAMEHDHSGAKTALRKAAGNGHVEVVRALLEDGRADPAADESAVFRSACTSGYVDIVSLFLRDKRADPATWNNWPLIAASTNGHTEVVRLLLKDPRVDPAARENYAIVRILWDEESGVQG